MSIFKINNVRYNSPCALYRKVDKEVPILYDIIRTPKLS